MKRKRKPKREPVPLLQLCLFDEQQMQAMTEPPPKKPAVLPTDPDPAWWQWQLMLAEGLRGQGWRQQRAMLMAGKKEKTRRVPVVPGRYLLNNELLI